jgi:hypothetical protein
LGSRRRWPSWRRSSGSTPRAAQAADDESTLASVMYGYMDPDDDRLAAPGRGGALALAWRALSRLAELPLDTLKIDRAFTCRIVGSEQNQAIVATLLALAGACGLATIAEGIETVEQVAILRSLGCDQCQGHLFCPAVTAGEIEVLLAEETAPHLMRRLRAIN